MKKLFLSLALIFVAIPSLAASSVKVHKLTAGTTDSALVAADAAGSLQLREFCGFSVRETGSSASATVDVYNGTDANGELIYTFSLNMNESRGEGPWDDTNCIPSPNGVFIDRGGTGTPLLLIYTRIR